MKNKYWHVLYLGIFVFLSMFGNANAVSKEVADKALAKFEELVRPAKTATPFETWTYDIAAFTVGSCWGIANPSAPAPKSLNVTPVGAGGWKLPDDNKVENLCESIASQGIKPVCTHSSVWVNGVKSSNKWPRDYLEAAKDYSNIKVEGILGCYLNSKQVQSQEYVANLTVEWTEKPHSMSIQAQKEAKTVIAGNILIKDAFAKGLDGKNYSEPKIVIIQE